MVLVFYPADYSPVCTSELALFQEILEDIRLYNAEVVAISTDSTFAHGRGRSSNTWASRSSVTSGLTEASRDVTASSSSARARAIAPSS